MNNFDFGEALYCLKCGQVVELELGGVIRKYYIEDGNVVCIPNGNAHAAYRVKDFKIDAVMSENWKLSN